MATLSLKEMYARLVRFVNSWEENAPDEEKFGDVTLTELKADRTAIEAKKEEIEDSDAHTKRLKIEYKDMLKGTSKKCDYVVRDVEGNRNFGPDCALYSGFGYIRESEKKRRGGRKPSGEI